MNPKLTTVPPSPPPSPDGTIQPGRLATSDELARQRAIKRIERRRHYYAQVLWSSIVMIVVAVIWAIAEYNNAGGWPANGFSQSSGIHDTWNMWIVYPFIAYLLFLVASSWTYFGRKPISESEIERELER